ncbi:MAG TPA: helix-turn-helix domain-containing protein [Bacteroidales bacterium]|nr:helix-turn-helix domain-containing protein [Bacteroidales bacterium]
MKDRIQLLIKAKNYTAAQFADEIGVQKSGVSHILSGRNNPSLDFVQKILARFPELSTDWLLFGRGPMMQKDIPAAFTLPPVAAPSDSPAKIIDLFSQEIAPITVEKVEIPVTGPEMPAANPPATQPAPDIQPVAVTPKSSAVNTEATKHDSKFVEKIIILFNDNSFKEYKPAD